MIRLSVWQYIIGNKWQQLSKTLFIRILARIDNNIYTYVFNKLLSNKKRNIKTMNWTRQSVLSVFVSNSVKMWSAVMYCQMYLHTIFPRTRSSWTAFVCLQFVLYAFSISKYMTCVSYLRSGSSKFIAVIWFVIEGESVWYSKHLKGNMKTVKRTEVCTFTDTASCRPFWYDVYLYSQSLNHWGTIFQLGYHQYELGIRPLRVNVWEYQRKIQNDEHFYNARRILTREPES
jgi:hypothetical protein